MGGFLLSSIAVVGYVGFGLAAGDNSRVRWPLLNETLGFVAAIGAPVAAAWITWHLYRIANSVITDEGLTVPGLPAPTHLRWNEVVSARLDRENIRLISPRGKFVIAAGMYASPEHVITFVTSKIECPVEGKNAA
jgi:hypothetical protein